MAHNIGDRVGDYQIIDVLGAGGMGKVYKVKNVISDRVEAMKVLLPNLASDPDLADRFTREIKVQASLHHPNIAALHTAQRVDNQLIMLIEFVEGSTLESVLRQGGPVPVPQAVQYISQVLLALQYAHSHGVVHRDIKPANMMLTPGGTVKLMDFGIAKLNADRRLTQTGRTVGSLYYMSPEQINGAIDLDPRADLYSLGVSLYELVTSTRPFQGDSDYSIMAAHLNSQPVPPIQIDPTLPSVLSDIILMAIAKDPAHRFQTADAFRKALESVEGEPASGAGATTQLRTSPIASRVTPGAPQAGAQQLGPPQTQPPPPASRRGVYMAVGSLVTVAVLAIAALQGPKWFNGSEASTAPPAQTSAPVPQNLPTAPFQPAATAPTEPVTPPPAPEPKRSVTPAVGASLPAKQVAQNTPTAPPPQQSTSAPVPAAQAPPAAAQTSEPAPDPGKAKALAELREHMIMLATRANAARATLTRMKEAQARQGLGMRGDILASEQRMEAFLDDAQAALRSGDPDRAKKALATAEREIDKLDGFLGR